MMNKATQYLQVKLRQFTALVQCIATQSMRATLALITVITSDFGYLWNHFILRGRHLRNEEAFSARFLWSQLVAVLQKPLPNYYKNMAHWKISNHKKNDTHDSDNSSLTQIPKQ
jgi:hypothetical protein